MYRNVGFLIGLAALTILSGCSSTGTASYYYAQKQLQNNQLDFHNRLRVDEYINAFPQDWLVVPPEEELVVSVNGLSKTPPVVGDNTLVQIAVKTRKASESEVREPISISLVIDVSGSMDGEYIDDTKQSLINAIKELNDGDNISIVTFNSMAEVIASNIHIDRETRRSLIEKVDKIYAGGGTNIEQGLIYGYRELSKLPNSNNKRLLMLTDGQSTVDSKTPEEIALRAGVEYLEGARISIIGLGLGVNEKLLRDISSKGNGHYYFADTSKTLTRILRDDLKSTVIPVAKNVTLAVDLGPGFSLVKVHGGATPLSLERERIDLNLGELNVDDWRIIILELKRHSNNVTGVIAHGTYQSIADNGTKSIRAEEKFDDSFAGLNKDVLMNSVYFGNAEALIEASRLSNNSNNDDAIRILDIQINNNKVINSLKHSEILESELNTLTKARNIILSNKTGEVLNNEDIFTRDNSDNSPGVTRILVLSGVKMAANSLPGLWSTVARMFLGLVEHN